MPQEQPQTMTILEVVVMAMRLMLDHGIDVPVRSMSGEYVASIEWCPHRREIVIDMADPIVFELDEEGGVMKAIDMVLELQRLVIKHGNDINCEIRHDDGKGCDILFVLNGEEVIAKIDA